MKYEKYSRLSENIFLAVEKNVNVLCEFVTKNVCFLGAFNLYNDDEV